MIIKKKVMKEVDVETHLICDICKKTFHADETKYDNNDWMEVQEFHHVRFTGGPGSIFGDGYVIECDICQRCLKSFIKGKYRVTKMHLGEFEEHPEG